MKPCKKFNSTAQRPRHFTKCFDGNAVLAETATHLIAGRNDAQYQQQDIAIT